jgi:3-hydroxymyristoyl/3-hydroxydecanoyl-(acyl carrier protein) dehydratase
MLDVAASASQTLMSTSAPTAVWVPPEQSLRPLSSLAPHTVLSAAELYPRICVRDPYFALKDVTVVKQGELVARVPVQQDPEAEAGPISIAESGRHLAILGSCASAMLAPKDGQHFYLACGARGQWLIPEPMARSTELLWGMARAEMTGKRTATARTLLSMSDGTPVFSLDVDYNVMSAAAFTRLFGEARVDMRREPRKDDGVQRTPEEWAKLRTNPYSKPLALRDWRPDGEFLTASLGKVTAEMCKGHFAMHPVMPVAIVASGMTRVATTLLRRLEAAPWARCVAKDVRLSADSLAYAGQEVTFGAQRRSQDGADHTFACWAAVGERVVAQLDVTFSRVD